MLNYLYNKKISEFIILFARIILCYRMSSQFFLIHNNFLFGFHVCLDVKVDKEDEEDKSVTANVPGVGPTRIRKHWFKFKHFLIL